jgi:acetyltransferase-like isoleucine patch superfamily enzyme
VSACEAGPASPAGGEHTERFAALARKHRFDFSPWVFWDEATPEEQAEQLAYQEFLAQTQGMRIGERSYVSETAGIVGTPEKPIEIGPGTFLAAHTYVTGPVHLGEDCSLNPFATLRGPITAGQGVRIGAYAALIGFNHGFARLDEPIHRQPHTSTGIVLGSDIWIGAHVTVLDGVRVEDHAILAAGAVVTRDVPRAAIVGGNPARVLRMRAEP